MTPVPMSKNVDFWPTARMVEREYSPLKQRALVACVKWVNLR